MGDRQEVRPVVLYYADNQREMDPGAVLAKVVTDLEAAAAECASGRGGGVLLAHPRIVGAALALGEVHQALADRLYPEEDGVSPGTDLLGTAGLRIGRCVHRSWRLQNCVALEPFDSPTSRARPPESAAAPRAKDHQTLVDLLASAREAVAGLSKLDLPDRLTARVPEGYAFYSLYPEMYFRSLDRLVKEMPSAGGYAVVGIRSIGASLAGLVAGALVEMGFQPWAETVRPRGHPFDRHLSLAPGLAARIEEAARDKIFIVVDEGPGLTCSSFVSVGSALERLGVPKERIAVLSAWRGVPSIYASDELRARWERQRVFHTDATEAFDNWRALVPFLRECLHGEGPLDHPPSRTWTIDDISYGRWRERVYVSRDRWPAVHRPMERTKLLVSVVADSHPPSPGTRNPKPQTAQPILLKFAGLGEYGEEKLERAVTLAEAGFSPPVLGLAYGFLAYQFVEGRPLERSDLSGQVIQRLAEYYAFLAGSFTSSPAPRFDRLAEMVLFNTRQAIGVDASGFIASWRGRAGQVDCLPLAALDGRPFPHEWILAPSAGGPVYLKTDSADHFRDHSLVGEQNILWDLAGACEEWQMDPAQVEAYLAAWEAQTGDGSARRLLDFYRAAYQAFRTASLHYAIHSTNEEDVRKGLQHQQFLANQRLALLISPASISISS